MTDEITERLDRTVRQKGEFYARVSGTHETAKNFEKVIDNQDGRETEGHFDKVFRGMGHKK